MASFENKLNWAQILLKIIEGVLAQLQQALASRPKSRK